MEKEIVEQKVFAIICKIFELDPLNKDINIQKIKDELYLDSVSTIGLVAGLEDSFGIEIEDESISDKEFSSFDGIVGFVMSKIAKGNNLNAD